ncbi:uncharacterized protein LOC110118727 [Ceratitis capitata]|uniref:uncharacterized protein LOC110118727 n=1 Tax=Ceratitis capitata TaxID=7213 RepID=UPI000A1137B8|nr:uncharacterized protein LOC110118727 [Ceratitis capitata]
MEITRKSIRISAPNEPRQRFYYTNKLNPKFKGQSLHTKIVCEIEIKCIIRIGYKNDSRHSFDRGKVKIILHFISSFCNITLTLKLDPFFGESKSYKKQKSNKDKMKRHCHFKSEVVYECTTSITASINQTRM